MGIQDEEVANIRGIKDDHALLTEIQADWKSKFDLALLYLVN